MIYGYNPSYYLSILIFVLYLLEVFSSRIIGSLWACSALQLESLFLRIESSYGLDWPLD